MATFSKQDIKHLAKLAKLEITDDEVEQLRRELTEILDYVERLQGVDVGDSEPTSQVTGLVDVWRDDRVAHCDIPRDELLKNAPEILDGYIKVKKVL